MVIWTVIDLQSQRCTFYLYDDSPVFLIVRDHVSRELLTLLSDGGGNGGREGGWRQVQVVTQNLCKLFRGDHSLCSGMKGDIILLYYLPPCIGCVLKRWCLSYRSCSTWKCLLTSVHQCQCPVVLVLKPRAWLQLHREQGDSYHHSCREEIQWHSQKLVLISNHLQCIKVL